MSTDAIPVYKQEFPDYDDVLPDLTPLEDNSWRKDSMPCFMWQDPNDKDLDECRVLLWCDYLNVDSRNNEGSATARFMITVVNVCTDDVLGDVLYAETLDELRTACNDWYENSVGYRPDSEEPTPMPLGKLVMLVGQSAYLAGEYLTAKTVEPEAPTLPPDPENMNLNRAEWANNALEAFKSSTNCDSDEVLSDLLANLMHWADRNNQSFHEALARAKMHYQAETSH